MTYDPTLYSGCAQHYLVGRPPYSAELGPVLADHLGLDGTGVLLDVGCGPGALTVPLAGWFERAIGLDPDADMLTEGQRHAAAHGVDTITWVQALAEDIRALDLPRLRLATFGQSFHWTDREAVAEAVYDRLEPGGAIALITHDIDLRPPPPGPGDPPIPHDEIKELLATFLGPDLRAGRNLRWLPTDRYEDALARTVFGPPIQLGAPAHEDITRDVDGVIAGYLSTSFAAPALFGERLDEFVDAMRALLEPRTATGRFWDWPGDTIALVARRGD